MSVILTPTDGTHVNLTITALNSLASSATAGWQSAMIDNNTLKASDFRVYLQFAPVNTAPGSDKAIYVYALPWYYDGSAWYVGGDGGTTTLPSGTQGTYTIAATHNLGLPLTILNYTTQNQPMRKSVKLSNKYNSLMPQAWSLVVINFTGFTLAASGNQISYTPITYVSV